MSKPDISEFEALTEATELRRQLTEANTKLHKLRTEKVALVEAVHDGAKDALAALGPVPPVKAPKPDSRKAKPEVALWHLTDWQGAKLTKSYNSEIMRERVLRYCDKAARLTEIQRAAHPVDECVILFGGDMLEGLQIFPGQSFEVDASLFGQFMSVGKLEAEVVRRALGIYQYVTVVQEWGNHGRVGSKRAEVPRSDNTDRMAGELARTIVCGDDEHPTADAKRVKEWRIDDEDIHHFEIGKYSALLIHGDEIGRGSQVSVNTIISHVKGWRSGAYDKPFQDVYAGHFHSRRDIELPWGGQYFQTGAPETDNRYARDGMASSSVPTQRLHFIDGAGGKVTAQYRVDLSG